MPTTDKLLSPIPLPPPLYHTRRAYLPDLVSSQYGQAQGQAGPAARSKRAAQMVGGAPAFFSHPQGPAGGPGGGYYGGVPAAYYYPQQQAQRRADPSSHYGGGGGAGGWGAVPVGW